MRIIDLSSSLIFDLTSCKLRLADFDLKSVNKLKNYFLIRLIKYNVQFEALNSV